MNVTQIIAVGTCVIALSGCQNMLKTMVAHVRINNSQTAFVAKGNAYTNFCLSKNLINRDAAYNFSLAAADYLDLVVFDNGFYKATYDLSLNETDVAFRREPGSIGTQCKDLESRLPTVTSDLLVAYQNISQDLSVSRAAERQQWAQSMSKFRFDSVPNTQYAVSQLPFPNRSYAQSSPQSDRLLVYSSGKLMQCKVTSNNFVFCL